MLPCLSMVLLLLAQGRFVCSRSALFATVTSPVCITPLPGPQGYVISFTSIYSSRSSLCSLFPVKCLLPKSKVVSTSSDLSSLGLGITWDRGGNAESQALCQPP